MSQRRGRNLIIPILKRWQIPIMAVRREFLVSVGGMQAVASSNQGERQRKSPDKTVERRYNSAGRRLKKGIKSRKGSG